MTSLFRFAAALTALALPWLVFGQTRLPPNDGAYDHVPVAAATYTQTGKGAVSLTSSDKLSQLIWIKEFGAVCDGSTDDTTAIQNAWNAGAAAGKSVYLGGVGTGTCKISTLAAPEPTSGEFGNRAALIGDGTGSTTLVSTVTGSNCAITLAPSTFGINSDYNSTFKGFRLKNAAPTNGLGLCLTNVTLAVFEDIWIEFFTYGVYAVDTLRVSWIRCTWFVNNFGVAGLYNSSTRPNAWTFITPLFAWISDYAIIMSNAADLNIYGGDWEQVGYGNKNAVSIYMLGNPIDGTKGLNITGGYFSGNNGIADILIDNASGSQDGVHSINGVEFQRNLSDQYVASNAYLKNNGSGKTTLNIAGSGFQSFSPYVANASRPYIGIATPSGANYVISTRANFYGSAVETPSGPWFWETSWAAFTPTLGCGSGALSGSNTATVKYKFPTLKSVAFSASLSFAGSAAGTCANSITFTLPYAAASAATMIGRDSTNNALWFCSVAESDSVAHCITTTGALPTIDNATTALSGTYERQ